MPEHGEFIINTEVQNKAQLRFRWGRLFLPIVTLQVSPLSLMRALKSPRRTIESPDKIISRTLPTDSKKSGYPELVSPQQEVTYNTVALRRRLFTHLPITFHPVWLQKRRESKPSPGVWCQNLWAQLYLVVTTAPPAQFRFLPRQREPVCDTKSQCTWIPTFACLWNTWHQYSFPWVVGSMSPTRLRVARSGSSRGPSFLGVVTLTPTLHHFIRVLWITFSPAPPWGPVCQGRPDQGLTRPGADQGPDHQESVVNKCRKDCNSLLLS